MAETLSCLTGLLDSQALDNEPSTLALYAVDSWQPALALFPSSPEETALALKGAAQEGLGVVPWGAGTKRHLGPSPGGPQVLLCSRRLSGILDYDPDNLTVTVGAGMALASLQETVRAAGQMVSLDPPHADSATLGGILAANSSGPRRFLYGGPRDLVLGLRAALPDGRIIKSGGKTVKNVAGYDLTKLFIGSMGTLGVIVEATLKLRPRPEEERTLVLSFAGLEQTREAAQRILGCPELLPAALELMEPAAAKVVAERMGLGPATGPLLAVALEGFREDVEAQVRGLAALAPAEAVPEGDALWRLLADGIPSEVVARAGVPAGMVFTFVEAASRLAADLGLGCPALAGAGTGMVRLYPLGGPQDSTGMVEFLRQARDLASGIGGYLVLEDAPPPVKAAVGVWGHPDIAFSTFEKIKAAFDPSGVLNPGRFVGGI